MFPDPELTLITGVTPLGGDRAVWGKCRAQVVLREAILSCVTPDRSRLPLLDAYVPWIKTNDFVRAPRHGHTPEVSGFICRKA